MGVQMYQGQLYSISEDKHFKVTNIKTQGLILDQTPTQNALNAMVRDGNRLFIACSGGKLSVYDISSPLSQLQIVVTNNKKNKIREICFDSARNYIFSAAVDGEICIFNVQKQGREKFTQVNASYESKPKIRAIAWSNSRSEGFLGDDDGVITFMNEKNGAPICKILYMI